MSALYHDSAVRIIYLYTEQVVERCVGSGEIGIDNLGGCRCCVTKVDSITCCHVECEIDVVLAISTYYIVFCLGQGRIFGSWQQTQSRPRLYVQLYCLMKRSTFPFTAIRYVSCGRAFTSSVSASAASMVRYISCPCRFNIRTSASAAP